MTKPENPPVLILIDLQEAINDPKWGPRNNPDAEDKLRHLLDGWRLLGGPIVHIRHNSTEPASPYRPDQPGNAFIAEVVPLPDETIIEKQAHSAFIGTNLEQHLRNNNQASLVLAGVLTHNSLEATARHAGDLGFLAHVVADASWAVETTDFSGKLRSAEDVHNLSLAHLDDEYAKVIDTAEALALLTEKAG